MDWIPKMHKNPTGIRFIITYKICSTEEFSKHASNILLAYILSN